MAWYSASTTHAISGSIMGVAAVRSMSAVSLVVGKSMIWTYDYSNTSSSAASFVTIKIIFRISIVICILIY